MGARRFFIADVHGVGDRVTLAGTDAHKIVEVLRLRSGDEVELVDSAAQTFRAELAIERGNVVAMLVEQRVRVVNDAVRIDVAQGIPKGAKMDFVVEKLTELGVATIAPFATERSVVREVGAQKVERWRRLARAAAQQCGRVTVPQVDEPSDFEALLVRFSGYDTVLFAWEVVQAAPLRETLPSLIAGAGRILVVIGPEGGFSHGEAERAVAAGAHLVSLGARILRSETAPLVLVAILCYLLETGNRAFGVV